MFRKPIGYFFIGLALFLFVFGILTTRSILLPNGVANWLAFVSFLTSLLFSLLAVIKGIRLFRRKENGLALNLVAIIGSSLIILFFIYSGIVLFLLSYH
jgi:hypothetical protein